MCGLSPLHDPNKADGLVRSRLASGQCRTFLFNMRGGILLSKHGEKETLVSCGSRAVSLSGFPHCQASSISFSTRGVPKPRYVIVSRFSRLQAGAIL
jgi:hypothetical protein